MKRKWGKVQDFDKLLFEEILENSAGNFEDVVSLFCCYGRVDTSGRRHSIARGVGFGGGGNWLRTARGGEVNISIFVANRPDQKPLFPARETCRSIALSNRSWGASSASL